LVNRDKAHVDAINQLGLRVQENGVDRFVKTFAVTTCSDVDLASGPIDLVIVLVKSFHTREAIESAKAILGKDTLVLSLQNGLGHEDILSKIVGTSRLLAGKTYAGGVIIGPGHIIAGTKRKETYIGELNGQISKRVSLIAKVFNDAGLLTHVSENITGLFEMVKEKINKETYKLTNPLNFIKILINELSKKEFIQKYLNSFGSDLKAKFIRNVNKLYS
jgi:2-dehydropantoate 2-reductase